MLLSEHPEYSNAVVASKEEDWDLARENFGALLVRARSEGDLGNLAFLLQQLGDIEAKSGNTDLGHSLHAEAISFDSTNPLWHLFYVKSLFRAFASSDDALARLQIANDLVGEYNFTGDEDDLPRSYFEREFERLREEISRDEP